MNQWTAAIGSIPWTPELALLCGLAALALIAFGLGLAKLLFAHQAKYLEQLVGHAQQQAQQATTAAEEAQTKAQYTQESLHTQQVLLSRLQEQLKHRHLSEQALQAALGESKTQTDALRASLHSHQQQQHSAEKQLEAAQADNRAHLQQLASLEQRLTAGTAAQEKERAQVNQLTAELAQEGKRAQALASTEKELREQLAALKLQLTQSAEQTQHLQERYLQLNNEHTELKTSLARKEEHYQEQLQQLSDNKQLLAKEFENLANKIFEEKGKAFTHTNQASLDALLKPFREQIEGFQKRINDVHDASLQGNTQLNAEIRKVLDIGLKMSQEAGDLSKALKGDSQQRGAWGEAQLKRTLEMSGLIENAHYEAQSAFKDAQGRQKQTDYLVKLPDDKHIIIDSKVTLNAYERVVTAQSPEALTLALGEHIRAVRKHIDDLAAKDYTNVIGMRSPGFVLMFMPLEPAYIEALKHGKDLFEYGYNKGVVLVSHTTLIPILRTVSNLWMVERSNAEAQEISERAGEIYNQVCTVAERLAKLGSTLGTVSKHYNSTVTALAGQQGLYGKVDRFNQLSAKVSKHLPSLEPAHMDFETERLSMIVEPIDEAVSVPIESEPLR